MTQRSPSEASGQSQAFGLTEPLAQEAFGRSGSPIGLTCIEAQPNIHSDMGVFRLWQPHTEEYMFMWNLLVAMHTIAQLSDSARARVYEHYDRIVALNRLNPLTDVALGVRHDPFWLAFSMADLAIFPIIGPKPAK